MINMNIIATKTFRDLQESLGHAAPFFLYGGVCLSFLFIIFSSSPFCSIGQVCLFGLLFIFIFLPETRGKTPEETAQNFASLRPNHFPQVEGSDVRNPYTRLLKTQNLQISWNGTVYGNL